MVHNVDRRSVREVMITSPKTHDVHVTIREARQAFNDDHVHMLLLTDEDAVLRGTLLRSDLSDDLPPNGAALTLARLQGRTIPPPAPVATAVSQLIELGERRIAVVDAGGRLIGLVCLKRSLDGFCTDAGVGARRAEMHGGSRGLTGPPQGAGRTAVPGTSS